MRLFPILTGLMAILIASPSFGQEISLSLGDGQSLSGQGLQLIALITILSLAPGLAITITCFPFIVTVLSILRQAIGLQQSPPNMLIVALALFLTYFVMDPVFQQSWESGIKPLLDEKLSVDIALRLAYEPFQVFMTARVDPDTLFSLADLRGLDLSSTSENVPVSILIPSFMLSEIARAFEVGFLIFLPFLIIDLITAAVLMSMGMMMVPPAIVSLPFKLAFFVVADGWTLVSSALVTGYQ